MWAMQAALRDLLQAFHYFFQSIAFSDMDDVVAIVDRDGASRHTCRDGTFDDVSLAVNPVVDTNDSEEPS